MLVAKRDLQVEHLLPMTLETKVARLDDARVDRPDRDLVDFIALDAVEIHDTGHRHLARVSAPRIMARSIRGVKTHRFQPRMSLGADAVLLGQLALEQMDLGTFRGQRGKAVGSQRGHAGVQQAMVAIGQDGVQVHVRLRRGSITEKGRDGLPRGHRLDDGTAKVREGQGGNLIPTQDLSWPQGDKARAVHCLASRNRAASPRSAASGAGMYTPRSNTRARNSRTGPPVLTLS